MKCPCTASATDCTPVAARLGDGAAAHAVADQLSVDVTIAADAAEV
ncbi:hypothetical protein [Mycobacterium sp.]|nr:hypothetical protein [Mycobacterium sp.]MBW0014501.1 hypothetical protein [Mycobacterium sp.]